MSRIDFEYRSEAVKYSENELVAILSTFNRTPNNVGEDINIIREWLKTQKHILIESSDREILYFLTTCKYSFEKTKEKINMYYCIRDILPEFYKNRKPSSKDLQECFAAINLMPLPTLTPELNRVMIYGLADHDPKRFKSELVNRSFAFVLDSQPILDVCNSNEYIFDLTVAPLEIVLKYSITDLKKILTVVEKVYASRIARIHIINAPVYFDALLAVVKTFLKNKIKERIIMHKGYEKLKDFIPNAILPSDYGGQGKSIAEIKEIYIKTLLEYDGHFEQLNGNAVDENLRPDHLTNDEVLGFHGSFRKLQVD